LLAALATDPAVMPLDLFRWNRLMEPHGIAAP
jgi:hypothetical protein